MKHTIIIIVITLMMLSGCGGVKNKPVVYKDKYLPIPYCPMPPEIETPSYYANTMTTEQKGQLGELAKAFVISSRESVNDSIKLRMMYDTYVELAENSERRIEAIEGMGVDVDRSMVEQANRETEGTMNKLSLQFEVQDAKLSNSLLQSLSQMNDEYKADNAKRSKDIQKSVNKINEELKIRDAELSKSVRESLNK